MSTWKIEYTTKIPKLKKPVLIEGLPGIGNVGKVALDFIIDEIGAKKLLEFVSPNFPNSVFVNEENLIELPTIEIYYKKFRNKPHDLLFLVGDIQPLDEVTCYEFSHVVLDLAKKLAVSKVITLGGVAMRTIPKNPKVFCTGNNKSLIKDYVHGTKVDSNLYGVIGPIVGVSGVLLGGASKHKIPAITLLAETYAHPMYLGISGAREIIRILNKKLELKLNVTALEKELKELEIEFQSMKDQNITGIPKLRRKRDISYIG